MEKIISAQIDETAAYRIGVLARRLRTSKKDVLERAIAMFAAQVDGEEESDVFERTCGAWSRKESPAEFVDAAGGTPVMAWISTTPSLRQRTSRQAVRCSV